MSARADAQTPLRLTLPAAAIKRLREAAIYCTPEISLEYQRAGKRYVLRGRESGGAVRQIGRYVTFCGEQGERLPWFLRPDSVTPNAEHAIVIAPALVSVEMFRIEHTYELLVARHQIHTVKEGIRPTVLSRVVFRGWQGQLPVDLFEKDRALAGQIAPEFFTRAGEPRQLPAEFVGAVQSVTLSVNCGQCLHPHFSIAPKAPAAAVGTVAEDTRRGKQAQDLSRVENSALNGG
jgi:hypothetical protein